MLRFSVRGAVDTAPLTRSFGWTSAETFMQQDVHECLSVLFQFLRESDAAASIGQEISSNHVGQQVAYIKCLECGYVSLRPEEMVELTLQVKGSPTLEHSIARYDRVIVIAHSYSPINCTFTPYKSAGLTAAASAHSTIDPLKVAFFVCSIGTAF